MGMIFACIIIYYVKAKVITQYFAKAENDTSTSASYKHTSAFLIGVISGSAAKIIR